MLQHTRGIVLRTTPFSETSLIVWVYTEHFGLQKYLQKGARRVSKKGGGSQQVYFQPAALLDLVVYHRQAAKFEIIKELQWGHVYQQMYQQVSRHAVASFMIELLSLSTKQPETNIELFQFMWDQMILLDEASPEVVAMLPSWFILHLGIQLGVGLNAESVDENHGIDLFQGNNPHSLQSYYVDGWLGNTISTLLSMENAVMLYRIKHSRAERKALLKACLQYFYYHQPDAGTLKSLLVLETVMG